MFTSRERGLHRHGNARSRGGQCAIVNSELINLADKIHNERQASDECELSWVHGFNSSALFHSDTDDLDGIGRDPVFKLLSGL